MNIAVIPARGGSKRIPRKNIKAFLGTPMLELTIEKLLGSRLFEKVVVSTDDFEIAQTAKNAGADVPFVRSQELSGDDTPTAPVIKNILSYYASEKYQFCCCVYPCTPLLTVKDLKLALDYMIGKDGNFCYPVVEFSHPIQRALRLGHDGYIEFMHPEFELTPTQKLDKFVHDGGQFYWGAVDAWMSGFNMHTNRAVGYQLPSWRIVDIDNDEDWVRAEMIYKMLA